MIKIQNVYYMLSYAFQTLQEQGYKNVAAEQFDNVAELCAAILIKGANLQIKRGLGREYISKTDTVTGIRGRINISESIKTQSMLRKQMVCTYDDFSVNTYMNQIIKTTMIKLLYADIDRARKKEIKRLLVFFIEVDTLDINTINWKQHFNQNNQAYQMLISVCYLVLKGLIQTTSAGTTRIMDFVDEQHMCHLYEKFILEYYRTEFPAIKAEASQIKWMLDDDNGSMLPIMKSDITLSYGDKILIIDAKYYAHTTQVQFDKHTIHSGNLYQIFTYVKNKEAELKELSHEVAGMLGYAEFVYATKLQQLILGNPSQYYKNANLQTLYLGKNKLLKKLDVRNCTGLGTGDQKTVDLSGCTGIEEVYFDGTKITGVTLPNGGVLRILHLPSTITSLIIRNQSAI